jgi:polyhydroxybutyrate depolymerase
MQRVILLAPTVLLGFACRALDTVRHELVASSEQAKTLQVGSPERPALLVLPRNHDGTPRPLIVLLHGYGETPSFLNDYLGLEKLTRARDTYLLLPESGMDSVGAPFWNATDACCDFDASRVDDVAALSRVIDATLAAVAVDRKRIYLAGHSNGGFMAYRMACEQSARFAAIAVFAGADFLSPTTCVPTSPISVLHLHGDADRIVPYSGGSVPSLLRRLPPFPGALSTVERWAKYAHCDARLAQGDALDLTKGGDTPSTEAETDVRNFVGCQPGFDVSLWTMRGEGHLPAFHSDGFGAVLDWLLRHTR